MRKRVLEGWTHDKWYRGFRKRFHALVHSHRIERFDRIVVPTITPYKMPTNGDGRRRKKNVKVRVTIEELE